jgi:hypothetical protein
MGLFDLFGGGDDESNGGLLGDPSRPQMTREQLLPLLMLSMGQGITNANQPGASFGQAVIGGGSNGLTSGMSQVMQLQAYQQRMKDAAADRAWKNDQRQAIRGQTAAQATLQGGYDPLSKINWNGPRATTPDTPPNERMALLARAYPDQFARQSLEAEFPTPGESERLVTRLSKMPQDDPMRAPLESRLAALNTEGGFRYENGKAIPVPGGPADPDYIARRYAAVYENRPEKTTQFERSIANLPQDQQDALRAQYAQRYARGRSTAAPVMRTIYGPNGQPQKVQWDEDMGEWANVGGSKAPAGRGGAPTPAQERINAEIDRARAQIGAMPRSELDLKTSPYDRLGMPNQQYDRFLTGTAKRALSRKTGEDPDYEPFANRFHGLNLPDDTGDSPQPGGGGPDAGGDTAPVLFTPGMKPQHGQIYTNESGKRARWDAMKNKFVEVP